MELFISGRDSYFGEVTPPGDKSISHRALIISAISESDVHISNLSKSLDVKSTMYVLRSLGTMYEQTGDRIIVEGKGINGFVEPTKVLDCGNSGTTMRMLCGLLAHQNFYSVLVGDKYLSKRPMSRIIKMLLEMGARIFARDNNQYAPITIKGSKLRGREHKLQISSAQVKSSLILAGLGASGSTSVTEPFKSRDHTENMLKYFGADIETRDMTVTIRPGRRLRCTNLEVPGDPSSAAFIIGLAIISKMAEVTVKNVCLNPTRAAYIDLFKRMGARIDVHIRGDSTGEKVGDIHAMNSDLRGVNIYAEDIPTMIDELPIIAIVASKANGKTEVSGARELRFKESDRIRTICLELKKMGCNLEPKEDGFVINGPCEFKPARLSSHGDHRIAMSLAVAALCSRGESSIRNFECSSVSYPGFIDDINSISGEVR
jgi:3-phosphoshikimate 1-carboxyvinyltransferase